MKEISKLAIWTHISVLKSPTLKDVSILILRNSLCSPFMLRFFGEDVFIPISLKLKIKERKLALTNQEKNWTNSYTRFDDQ